MKKLIIGLTSSFLLATGAYAAVSNSSNDCCASGSSCCSAQASCCKNKRVNSIAKTPLKIESKNLF